MSEPKLYPIHDHLKGKTFFTAAKYQRFYNESIENPEAFWAKEARRLDWIQPFTKVKNTSYHKEDFHIRWYEDGTLNACYNCVDRHLKDKGDQVAIFWEGDNPEDSRTITYKELHQEISKFANVLKMQDVHKGDRVTIYLPMIPEAIIAILACARIGAIHSVVFAGFSAESLEERIFDCDSHFLVTADEGVRGGKKIPLKKNVEEALQGKAAHILKKMIVVKRTGGDIPWQEKRDFWYHEEMDKVAIDCPLEEMGAEDPLFILYTSGSTGKPKGVLHTIGGYLVYAALTHQYVFDYHPGDIYWCTADIGWVTGHTYSIYGPLANGATIILFEGVPQYPDALRFWQIVDKYKVTIFYTAPTVIRSLMREGTDFVQKTSRASLRILGSVGEPINPEAWEWYYDNVGNGRCPIMDTWWQTETGGILISALPGVTPLKPGSATFPLFGVKPALVNHKGQIIENNSEAEGNLVLLDSWPGQMRTVYGDQERFIKTYFTDFPGMYFSGDGARRDKEGNYWITGRVDDVINVSGHRLGTAEMESALDAHPKVVESAVVGFPHDIKGQGIYAFVTLHKKDLPSESLRKELIDLVRRKIGAIATPDRIQWASGLPKTRSGKIMRRILRKIAANELETLGDISTLADPLVVDDLVKNHRYTVSAP
jgi:acetyl-CoA synthetase